MEVMHPLRAGCGCYQCVWREHFHHWWTLLDVKGACHCLPAVKTNMAQQSASSTAVPDSMAHLMPPGVFDAQKSLTFQNMHSREQSPSPKGDDDDPVAVASDVAGYERAGDAGDRLSLPVIVSGTSGSSGSDDSGSDGEGSSQASRGSLGKRRAIHALENKPEQRRVVVEETQLFPPLPPSAVHDSVQEIAGKVRLLPRPPLPSPPKLVSLPPGETWASPSPPRRSFYFP